MSKHKKTLKEKVIADFNRQVYILKNKNIPFNNSTLTTAISKNSHFSTYILKDVLKTGILISSIITGDLILFFLLKRHILSIPNLNY